MTSFQSRIKSLRDSKKLTMEQLSAVFAEKYDATISKSSISRWEEGQADPDTDHANIYADYFNVSLDWLTNGKEKTDNDVIELTAKDERDIQKELQKMIQGLGSNSYAAFGGETLDDMDQEDRELLIASLENSLRLAKR